MNTIKKSYDELKKKYDKKQDVLSELSEVSSHSLSKLENECQKINFCRSNDKKEYFVYELDGVLSRPINKNLLLTCEQFNDLWTKFFDSIDSEKHSSSFEVDSINKVLYTAIIGFSAAFDIWKPTSRKTPGTYFEILLGSVISKFLPEFTRKKFITLPKNKGPEKSEPDEKVSTDIVFEKDSYGIVIPAKITTRERIVQPYAHQLILDAVFGNGHYKSILLSVSETQRDEKNLLVNDICVPGTIKLFQQHMANLSGLYYLDPPSRYCEDDITNIVNVSNYGELLTQDLKLIVDSFKSK